MSVDPKLYQILLDTFKEELDELHQSLIKELLALETAKPTETEEILKNLFRYSHNIKGAAASASVSSVSEIAHHLENLFSKWKKDKHKPKKQQISACLEVTDNLLLALAQFCNDEPVDVKAYLAPLNQKKSSRLTRTETYHEHYLKLPLSRVERVSAQINEFIPYQLKLAHWQKDINHVLQKLLESFQNSDQLMMLAKKLAIISNESSQFLGELTRSIQALQHEMKTLRMLPISVLLVPLSRTARDIATQLNKSIILKIEGGEVELDKTIIDAIRDPLLHLVRNAIDHGIEADHIRKQMKKPIPATLSIRISNISAKIKIEVIDDGAGIDCKKIKQQILSSGLYSAEEVKNFTDKDILNCLFISGFSTQKKVTEISGRGVGLDIVKNSLLKINGTVSLETKINQGTRYSLTVPLTLATTRGVFFKVNEQKFMIPTMSLNMLYKIIPKNLQQVDNKYVLNIDNEPIAIKLLSEVLKIKNTGINQDQTYYAFLMAYQNEKLLILVDSIIDEHDYLVKPLPHPYTQLDYYIGVSLTESNELALVLDPTRLMEISLSETIPWLGKIDTSLQEKQDVRKKRILVVDDSLTSRTLCANAVMTAGYEAITTVDGQKAWDLIQTEPFDCVITDILMPEMNGLELTKKIKKHKKYAQLPVIIITSLDSKEDKKKGLEVGANAFVVKNEFDTLSLIHIMETLI